MFKIAAPLFVILLGVSPGLVLAQNDAAERWDRLERRLSANHPVVLQSVEKSPALDRLRVWYEQHQRPQNLVQLLRLSVYELESMAIAMERKTKVDSAQLNAAVGKALSLLASSGIEDFNLYLQDVSVQLTGYDFPTVRDYIAGLALTYAQNPHCQSQTSSLAGIALAWVDPQTLHSLSKQLERSALRWEGKARSALIK